MFGTQRTLKPDEIYKQENAYVGKDLTKREKCIKSISQQQENTQKEIDFATGPKCHVLNVPKYLLKFYKNINLQVSSIEIHGYE